MNGVDLGVYTVSCLGSLCSARRVSRAPLLHGERMNGEKEGSAAGGEVAGSDMWTEARGEMLERAVNFSFNGMEENFLILS